MKDAGDAQHVGKQLFMYSMPLYVDRAWRERGEKRTERNKEAPLEIFGDSNRSWRGQKKNANSGYRQW